MNLGKTYLLQKEKRKSTVWICVTNRLQVYMEIIMHSYLFTPYRNLFPSLNDLRLFLKRKLKLRVINNFKHQAS